MATDRRRRNPQKKRRKKFHLAGVGPKTVSALFCRPPPVTYPTLQRWLGQTETLLFGKFCWRLRGQKTPNKRFKTQYIRFERALRRSRHFRSLLAFRLGRPRLKCRYRRRQASHDRPQHKIAKRSPTTGQQGLIPAGLKSPREKWGLPPGPGHSCNAFVFGDSWAF